MGKETGGKKMHGPHFFKSSEVAECSFVPQHLLVCDTCRNREGLPRVAFMGGDVVVMLGQVISCEQTDVTDKHGVKRKYDQRCAFVF